ncbi:unnamed protein product [Cochlearia groenlandica]
MEDNDGNSGDAGEVNGVFSPNSSFGAFPETAMDLDFMDELLFDGCWLETIHTEEESSTAMNENTTPFLAFDENPSQEDQETEMNHEAEMLYWIAPSSSSSVKERLIQAISGLNEAVEDKDFLVQIWVPFQQEGKKFLTTWEQPHLFNQNHTSLEKYRQVSETYNLSADEGSKDVGLPGRVFLQKLPEWTPDVRFFKSDEYPRIKEAQKCDVRGSLALPVFERGSGTCLGVVEIVMTTQKMNYRPELENICKALEAVDLSSSSNLSTPSTEFLQVYSDFYIAALPEISNFLASTCKSYNLPLALTWAPCARHGKHGSRHSDENFARCVSTIDSACFVHDEDISSFLEACSEHHLLTGEGIVGKAFEATKLFFVPEVTTFSKTNYPLLHHAKISGLHAALAVPLKRKGDGFVEFVLEFVFPKGCVDTDAQQEILKSLSSTLQQGFVSSDLVIDKDLELEVVLPVREDMVFSEDPITEESLKESSWISHMLKANEKGKDVSLSWEYQKEDPKDELNNNPSLEDEKVQGASSSGVNAESASASGGRRGGDKRRIKNEKTIGLEVLRQHFAGSLKDAAKNIGVCPTTLKRICRQHGIARWPSRKIKKVGHSLKKLQQVMDSVQGAQGTIQLDSFYTSFPELSSPNTSSNNVPSLKSNEHINAAEEEEAPKSPTSSCSKSSGSSTNNQNTLVVEEVAEEATCLVRTVEEPPPPLPFLESSRTRGGIKVKATFGEARVRFTLLPTWGFRELKQEIARRFNVDDVSWFDLKYLDDDKELVLLTCEADLEECIDIYRISESHTIKISVEEAVQVKLGGSFGNNNNGPSL